MKNLTFLVLLATLVGIASCGPDEETQPKELTTNFIKFNDKYYPLDLSRAFLDDYGCDETHCNIDFRLFSKGNFAFAYLELFQFNNVEFSGGSFSKGDGIESEFDNWKGNYLVINGDEFYPLEGFVTVSKSLSSNEWIIEFEYLTGFGIEINGHVQKVFD